MIQNVSSKKNKIIQTPFFLLSHSPFVLNVRETTTGNWWWWWRSWPIRGKRIKPTSKFRFFSYGPTQWCPLPLLQFGFDFPSLLVAPRWFFSSEICLSFGFLRWVVVEMYRGGNFTSFRMKMIAFCLKGSIFLPLAMRIFENPLLFCADWHLHIVAVDLFTGRTLLMFWVSALYCCCFSWVLGRFLLCVCVLCFFCWVGNFVDQLALLLMLAFCNC